MNNYLAKSNPRESIQQHTDKLIKNYEILKYIYPNLNVNWDMLRIVCLYHDLGKMNLKFQQKLEKIKKHSDEIAHNLLSIAFVNPKELKEKYNFSNKDIEVIAQAIARHHDRGDYNEQNYDEEVELIKKEAENFVYDKVNISNIKRISVKYFSNNRIYASDEYFFEYVKIKGLLNRLDYAASAGVDVEVKNDFLNDGLDNFHNKSLKPRNLEWNELQIFMKENSDKNVVVVAQTGMGKTEAGLLWIGDNKGFFTLPLKTAINEIYKRVIEQIAGEDNKEKVGLLHSDTYSKYLEGKSQEDDINEYYTKTKQLSLPLTICTLDQIFDFVFRYRDFEPKLATLSYSKIIIDEIQMYSPDLLAYLIIGLSFIDKIGGKFAILTATLPSFILDLMKKEDIRFIPAEKAFINEIIRHSLRIIDSEIDSEVIASNYDNNKVLVICNTVKKAQDIYDELCNNENLKAKGVNIQLLHSKFIKRDRKNKEKEIIKLGDSESKETGIWIATQIVEVSLDIDFDVLFTELSDINGLFQRLGRCYRKREFNKEGYNCYVFNGGEKWCSGIKYVIDEKVFEFSKEALKDLDGKITEKQKLDIIDKVYSTEKLKDTQYYKKVEDNIKFLKCVSEYELSKSEVRKRFRNISNITVIPKLIYDENIMLIDENIEILNSQARGGMSKEELQKLKEQKINARDKIQELILDIPYYEYEFARKNLLIDQQMIEIDKYNSIPIIKFDYSFEKGLQKPKNIKFFDEEVQFI